MPGNKKRRKFNSNNSHNRGNQNGFGRGGRAPATQTVTVKDKKRQLIRERIHPDDKKYAGMRALHIITLIILLSRLALFIYEMVFYSVNDLKIEVLSNILLLPLLIILFMVKDGNRGLIGICSVSAIVRMIYLFVSVYPDTEAAAGAAAFVAVYAVIMAVQFTASVLALSMPSADAYSKEMQKINMELRVLIMSGKR